MKDVEQLREKMVGLARTIPAEKYSWRPAAGVRSVGEVLLHVASDNYFIPTAVGVAPDPATGIKGDDYKTLETYEKKTLSRDAIIAELEKSFAHLKKAMTDSPESKLADKVKFFGQEFTVQQVWILTTTHLHEHLGQAIAYARSNDVVPPWSK